MFSAPAFTEMYANIVGGLSQPIILAPLEGATTFGAYPSKAHVSTYKETELVANGSILLGDLKLIINVEDLPPEVSVMGLKDRIVIDGRNYSVIHWDAYTRTVGETRLAIEAAVRGGGAYQVPLETGFLVTEGGDQLVTEAGDLLITEQEVAP